MLLYCLVSSDSKLLEEDFDLNFAKFQGTPSLQNTSGRLLLKRAGNFIEITLRHGCSDVNLLHIFKTPFPKNTSGWLLLKHSL